MTDTGLPIRDWLVCWQGCQCGFFEAKKENKVTGKIVFQTCWKSVSVSNW